ncbi:ImcF-related family protein [Pantoea sp. Tr-811]|uniref:ImcF-related family protein n=1 Tax=Pantoea sp. Tr-811 TaxID=2608361 RepID=UPI001F04DFCC|nr:ImcF-related family protein [Pantoea sp. Tr-811]
MRTALVNGLLFWALCYCLTVLTWLMVQRDIWALVRRAHAPLAQAPSARPQRNREEVASHLRHHYGLFWRWRVRVYLLVGEPEQVEALAPTLVSQQWLEGRGYLLLWGGSLQQPMEETRMGRWAALQRRHGYHGVVWVLNQAQLGDASAMAISSRRLQALASGWQLPLHLWQVCNSDWPQQGRSVQPVGCLLPQPFTAAGLASCLDRLQQPLREQGLKQMQQAPEHDFLLRLARELRAEGAQRWQETLKHLASARGISLRGLWFSLPLAIPGIAAPANYWQPNPAWPDVFGQRLAKPARLGWSLPRATYVAALSVAALWCVGMMASFFINRAEAVRISQALATLQHPAEGIDPLATLRDLSLDVSRLAYRADHGAPWYYRFGLDRTRTLRDAAWPHYVQAVQQFVRDPAAASLQAQLASLVQLPPGSPERARRTPQAYAQLKAYLMLARPEKAEADFLVQALGTVEPGLWRFYAEHLPNHPEWAITPNQRLIGQVRQVLLAELGQRNAEATLYQQLLDTAANHYPPMALQHMVGDTDAAALFTSSGHVPGVFTRQAWEGQVRAAIDDAAKARREEIDWVLSDNQGDIAGALSPEQLKARLTARYFKDYSRAWLSFLNRLRLQQSTSLQDVIAQLTVMSDARQSPLIALMNTLRYQGHAGVRSQALADSLIESAQQWVGQKAPPLADPLAQTPGGPLDSTFGPLLALLGKDPEARPGNDALSLQAFLTRVTSVRLKLQQITTAPDPQAMTQALAQTVFQGKGVDLTDAQSYGSLIAASLGAEWGPVAHALFVQPLAQAWQQILQPSSAGLNRDWQRAIVDEWHGAFDNRYPFAASSSDASLPMLGQMIRADSGRIEQFLNTQLNGLLRKEGSRWVIDPRQAQGLRFNPAFLAAINQLSQLADVLYTDGGMGMGFELRGKPVRHVVQTSFVLNGAKHHYFNQRERWQRFVWPGQNDHPGVSLTWTSVDAGERLYADYQGTWGLIRLLEEARVTPLDDGDSRFQVVLNAPDGLGLTWHLRTELAEGPLALLKLRSFRLPRDIFLVDATHHPQPGAPL